MAASDDAVVDGQEGRRKNPGTLEVPVGAKVTCTNILNEVITGEVAAFFPSTKAIVIFSSSDSAKPRIAHTINLNHVKEGNFKIISMPDPTKENKPLLSTTIDTNKAMEKIRKETNKLYDENDRIGVNVTKQAQLLFNEIAKTIRECKWKNDVIVVMDEVHVAPPYNTQSCTGSNGQCLDHIKKIVEKFNVHIARDGNTPVQ